MSGGAGTKRPEALGLAEQPGCPSLGFHLQRGEETLWIQGAARKAQLGAPGPVLTKGVLDGCGGLRLQEQGQLHSALSWPFPSLTPAASIFSLKEIQLQKDPGYRGLAFQQPGRGSCLPHLLLLLEEARAGGSTLLRSRDRAAPPAVGISVASLTLACLPGARGEQGRDWFPYLLARLPPPAFPSSTPTLDRTLPLTAALRKVHAFPDSFSLQILSSLASILGELYFVSRLADGLRHDKCFLCSISFNPKIPLEIGTISQCSPFHRQ